MRLVLASGSPQRAALLDQLGVRFEVAPPEIDEIRAPDEEPAAFVERLAREKALAVVATDVVVVAADTAVVHEGHVMGKPAHPEEARSMLRRLHGEVHEVVTGLAVASDEALHSVVDITTVRMLTMTDDEINEYVDSGEPMDKAGAYALQGRGGVFVEAVSGSPFTVIGMPIHLLPRLLARVDADLRHFEADRRV